MRLALKTACAAACMFSFTAFADEPTIDVLKARITELEQENAKLREQIPAPDNQRDDEGSEAGTAASAEVGFRGLPWGSNATRVKKAFKGAKKVAGGFLLESETIAGFPAATKLFLTNGRLSGAKVIFLNEHANRTAFISDYQGVKELLSDKYGAPQTDRTFWHDDLYRDDPSDWGTAVAIEHLSYFSEWSTPGTKIVLGLYGRNRNILFGVEYHSTEMSAEVEAADKKAKLRGL